MNTVVVDLGSNGNGRALTLSSMLHVGSLAERFSSDDPTLSYHDVFEALLLSCKEREYFEQCMARFQVQEKMK